MEVLVPVLSGITAAAAPCQADETCGNAETSAAANAGETTTGATAETSHRRVAFPQPATVAHAPGPAGVGVGNTSSGRNLALATPSLFVFENYPSNITAFDNSFFIF